MDFEQTVPLGVWFGLSDVPSLEITPYGEATFAVARLEARNAADKIAAVQLPRRLAYLMLLRLGDSAEEIRRSPDATSSEGFIYLWTLNGRSLSVERPLDCLAFYLPEALFAEFLAVTNGGQSLTLREVDGVYDDVMRSLGIALTEILRHGSGDHGLVMQHIAKAVCAHLVHFYGDVAQDTDADGDHVPLSRRQESHAKAFMNANFAADISLRAIASAACSSVSYFSERFRRAVGVTPLVWLQRLRVYKAKGLLVSSEHPEEIVALMCGFTTVSRFRTKFTAETGIAPHEWRGRYLG